MVVVTLLISYKITLQDVGLCARNRHLVRCKVTCDLDVIVRKS